MRCRVTAEARADGLAGLSGSVVAKQEVGEPLPEMLRTIISEGLEYPGLGGIGNEVGHVGLLV